MIPYIYVILGFEEIGAACRSETVSQIRCTTNLDKADAIFEELNKDEDIYRAKMFTVILE